MLPDPQTIPIPVPKTDPLATRRVWRPLRRALLRATGLMLSGPGRGPAGSPKNILLVRPDHLGDMLFVTPALKFLREQLPDARITLFVGPWARAVVEVNPHVDAVQTLDFPGFTRRAKRSPVEPYRLALAAAGQLRTQQFDAALILRFDHWWGALLAALARIPRRIGYAVPEVRPFLSDAVPYTAERHEVAQNIRLAARAAGVGEPERVTPQQHPLEFCYAPAAAEAAQQLLAAHGIAPTERVAVLVPGSGAPVKAWRTDAFARVVDALGDLHGLTVVAVGTGAVERALVEQIAAQARRPLVNACDQTSLAQLAALLGRAALAVGADSGPMHLAVAAGTPSVHLFGPVSARAFGPWGDPARHVALTSGLACIPCNRLDYAPGEVPAHPCVRLIAERQVLAAVEQVI